MKFRHRIVPYWFINTLLKWIRLPQIAPKQFWAIIFRKRIKINCLKNWGSINASPTYIIIINYDSILLDNCSNTSRSYCTSTLTLPVLDLSLSSTMLFVDFMLFLGTTYIMYFYFPKLLEPFWSHLNSSTSTSICLSFYCNNSYENWKFQAL